MWSKKSEACIQCKRSDIPHHAHELCRICHTRKVKMIESPYRSQNEWSRKFDFCQKCGTNDFPHVALGFCSLCYEDLRRERLEEKRKLLNIK